MIRSVLWIRVWNLVGLVCLAMSLLLLPAGVRSVRAADGDEPLMSVDPSLLPNESAILNTPPAAPVIGACEAKEVIRPHLRLVADESRIPFIVLNTGGYNYDSLPSALDPAALRFESKTR